MRGDRSLEHWTSEDLVLFLYLIIGCAGTATLIALEAGIAEFLYHFIYVFVLSALVLVSLAWIPAVFLIVVYRNSLAVVIPAATALVASISLHLSTDPRGAPLAWAIAFFPVAFVCGLVWTIRRKRGTHYE